MIRLHKDPGAFLGLDENCSYDESKFTILPIEFDLTSTWQKGADKGPDAILEASANLELYDIETGQEPWKSGVVTLEPLKDFNSPEAMVAAVKGVAEALLADDKMIISIGGEHSVSIGIMQAYKEKFSDLTVLQIDAHSDTREEYEGSKCNHACVMARAAELGDYVQVGIRSMDSSELNLYKRERTFFAHEIQQGREYISASCEKLSENVYVTIDLDGFDSAVMPSTGTPEPGGLSWYQVTALLKEVTKNKNVVGFDVVELMPNAANRAPDFLAAKLIHQFMAYILANSRTK